MTKLEMTLLCVIAALFIALTWVVVAHVHAADAWPEWTDESKLKLGQCLVAETDFTAKSDWPSIGHVLVKTWRTRGQRQGWGFGETIHRYCNVFRHKSERAHNIRQSTWELPLHGKARCWIGLRAWVDTFAARGIPDPTPLAEDWNCPGCFKHPENFDTIVGPPLTANVFVRAREN